MEPYFGKNEAMEEYAALVQSFDQGEDGMMLEGGGVFLDHGFYTSFQFSTASNSGNGNTLSSGNASGNTLTSGNGSGNANLQRSKLQNALIRRAMEVIRRSQLLTKEKAPIMALTAQGALSESFISRFLQAEKETVEETFLIKEEAEFLKPGMNDESEMDDERDEFLNYF